MAKEGMENKTVEQIKEILSTVRPLRVEDRLHNRICRVLKENGVAFVHEMTIPKVGRLDFFIPSDETGISGVAVEVKTKKTSVTGVARQVLRYQASERVESVILLTTFPIDLPPLPLELPVFVVELQNNAF
jgi:Holliday junction resolvase-like predicted endonuclease